jgi:hypothetical protein
MMAANGTDAGYSYVGALARLIDIAYPSHQLQASVLAYPLQAEGILKRRIVSLGFELANGNEDSGPIDCKFTTKVLRQICRKLENEQRFYFEFSFTERTHFRVGM